MSGKRKPNRRPRPCTLPGCEKVGHVRKGMCEMHYTRFITTGDPTQTLESLKATRLAAQIADLAASVGGKPIPGWDGFIATADGRIYTVLNGRGIRPTPLLLNEWTDRGDYRRVRLKGRRQFVHRLVLLTFVGPCPQGQQTRHLNGVKADNALTNLRYGTAKENAADRELHGTQGRRERHPAARWSDEQVASAVRMYETTALTQAQVGALFGTTQAIVSGWVLGARAGGPNRYVGRAS